MNLSRKWLSEYTDIKADSAEYESAMTMSGSKVEATYEPSAEIKNVAAGRVTAIERHPDSDHLWICSIDVGRDAPVQIVTGAQNVRQGDMVPVALHKSLLPGGKKIEKGKLRGVKSEGMLCSLSELNLDLHDFPYAEEDGIFIMQEPCSPGDDIRPIIGADDSTVEFEITNNRPDCLSVIGLARESAATFGTELTIPVPQVKGSGGDIREHLSIEIKNPELCPRYTARIVKNIKIEPSPKWMRQRLRASGVRPINNIVDITNYVMLEYGQPMHAFDYACLTGGKIIVRTAENDEKTKTLDGAERILSSEMLVIADSEKPVGIAGVMGGENSEITENTGYAVFESANFNGVSVRRTAMTLGLRTDASGRFEKALDIENTLPALERACELVELLGAGEVVDGIIDIRATPPEITTIPFEPEKINRLLGCDIPADFMLSIFKTLGFTLRDNELSVPSWRGDVTHYTDLAEEAARFYGYDKIPPTLTAVTTAGSFSSKQTAELKLGVLCRALGFSEIYTYSFIGQGDYDKVGLDKDSHLRSGVVILNPLGEDTSIMRTTPLPSMLGTLSKNSGSRNKSVRLYELAKIYIPTADTLPDERPILTLGAYGDIEFFAMKGCVETILREMRVFDVTFRALKDNPSYHPGRTAEIYSGDMLLGIIGQIHPTVCASYSLSDTYTAQIDFPKMLECSKGEGKYTPLPRFPSIARDLAVVCDFDTTAAALTDCINGSGGEYLREVKLFDIYTGPQVPNGKKSVAFSLELRSDTQTLTDEKADESVNNILKALSENLDAQIR